jgi:glycosyltransferase involved in cell wall biosynthesis
VIAEVLQLRSSAGLYGADQALLSLSEALPRHSVNTRLLCIRNYRMPVQALHEAASARGLGGALLPCAGRLDRATLRALREECERAPRAIVHVHDYKSASYAWLAARRRRVPLVSTLHGWIETSAGLRLYKRIELRLLRDFDALVVVAQAQRAVLQQAGVRDDRIHSIPNGIDTRRFSPQAPAATRAEFALGASTFVFGCVARLAPEKNVAALLDAFAALRGEGADIALLLVGDGPQRAALAERAVDAGVDDVVRFAGAVADTSRIYPLLDAFVLPSLTEGMPLAVLEAMACERPIVATSVGEVPILLHGTDRAMVVRPGDVAELLHAMRATFAAGRGRDAAARARVERAYSIDRAADAYATLYRTLTAVPA